jgi:hypothetical protein
MRTDLEVRLVREFANGLRSVVASGNSSQEHVWRARILLLSADGIGTMEIRRRTGKGKPTIRRLTAAFHDLQAAINRFVAETNQNSKPFVWTR